MDTTDTTTTTTSDTTNYAALLERAIAERVGQIHLQEREAKLAQEEREAADRARQQRWLESQLPPDVRKTLGVTLDPEASGGRAHATFTFEGQRWHLYQANGRNTQIVTPDGTHHHTYHQPDALDELLGALGLWREREAKRQAEAQEKAEQDTAKPKAPRIVTNGEVFYAVLSEELATYNDALTSVTAFLRPSQITLHRISTVVNYDEDGRPAPYGKEFSLTDDELDMLIQARELFRERQAEERERRASNADDVPF